MKRLLIRRDGVTLKGYLAYNDSIKEKRPGVLVVHEWWGNNDYSRKRADMLAELGYVAFAVDMYGGGKVADNPADAGKLAGEAMKNMKEMKARFIAALASAEEKQSCRSDPNRCHRLLFWRRGRAQHGLRWSGFAGSGQLSRQPGGGHACESRGPSKQKFSSAMEQPISLIPKQSLKISKRRWIRQRLTTSSSTTTMQCTLHEPCLDRNRQKVQHSDSIQRKSG